MLTNATVTIKRRGITYSQSTGRQTAVTATAVLQNAPCLVGQSKSRRIVNSDGMREIVKPAYGCAFEVYDEITILPGDQAEITMRGATETHTYTVEDAILSVGIRRRVWQLDIERIKETSQNA